MESKPTLKYQWWSILLASARTLPHLSTYSDFVCFSQYNNGVNISVVYCIQSKLAVYLHYSLLYTCSNLLTVNMVALNTVPTGTGE